ncbi:MAG: DUF1015 domain-containing protein [Acidobacteriota bacterium]|nr:DUF1015 domain-containing protein [Acidobacteriota bacterium]
MRIFAFQGIRYADRNGPPGRFAAPPYDQIDDALRDRLQTDPLSFAHLLRPVPSAGVDPFEHAASLHRRWLTDGTIARDPRPGLYPYEIRLATGGRRLGLATLVGIEEPSSGVIRPHERTVAKTVDERLRLLRAMQADIGPVLLLSEDRGSLDPLLSQDIETLSPVAEHRDDAGNTHRTYHLTDSGGIARYRDLLAPCAGLIADGHHRYKVASLYARESGAAAGTAAASKLAVITSLESPGLSIDPIHRALATAVGLDSPTPAVLDRAAWNGDGGAEFAAAVAAAGQPSIGVLAAGRPPEIWQLDPDTGPAELPRAASDLSVVLLHHSVFPVCGLDGDAAVDGTIAYRSDPDVLWRSVSAGEMAAGFFLPPMSAQGFAAAIAGGDVLPPKSTRFLPKLVSGLVWATHDAEVA